MTNKLTRKGLAFATSAVLALAGLSAATPAFAAGEALTLNPAAGSTYESINQSGVVVATGISNTGSTWTPEGVSWVLDSANTNYTTAQLVDLVDSGKLNVRVRLSNSTHNFNTSTGASTYGTGRSAGTLVTVPTDISIRSGSIVVKALEPSAQEDGGSEDNIFTVTTGQSMYVELWTAANQDLLDIKVSVRSWHDSDWEGDLDSGEVRSSSATVTLHDVRTVSSTTTVFEPVATTSLRTKTVLNKPGINTYFVSAGYALDGKVVGAHYKTTANTLSGAFERADTYVPTPDADFAADADNITAGIRYNYPLIATSSSNVEIASGTTSTNYASRAWFQDSDSSASDADFVKWLGSRSSTSAVFAGGNADVNDIYEYVTEGDNLVQIDPDEVDLRTGTASAVVSAQITDVVGDLEAANVRVRATFTAQNLVDEDSEITVTGVTGDAAEDEDLVAYGRTDAKGQISFTFANSGADELDSVYVLFEVLNSAGVWVDGNGMDFEWVDAYLDDFTVSDDALSGSSITLDYEAVDQFGKGFSSLGEDSEDALQVTLFGVDDDENTLDKTALTPTTKSLVGGKVSFTFSNYAAVDSFVWVAGILHTANFDKDDFTTVGDSDGADVAGENSYEVTRAFKNDATKAVESVENEYANEVSYTEFRTGTYADEDFYDWMEDTGDNAVVEDGFGVRGGNDNDGEKAVIEGSIETANGNGAAYQAVTISSAGLYFTGTNAAGDFAAATGSLTVETDADGNFEVNVYSHLENLTGKSITITSGGKSATTLLKTYMSEDIDNEDYWNGSAWVDGSVLTWNWANMTGNMPGNNTQYQIKVTVKDVWGNKLSGAEIEIYQNGWADVGVSREDDFDEDDYVTADVNYSGVAKFNFSKGPFYANTGEDYGDEEEFMLAPGGNSGLVWIDLDEYTYDLNGDGDTTDANEFDVSSFFSIDEKVNDLGYTSKGIDDLKASFKFGAQAIATEAAKKGAVKVQAANVKGKTVKVYVAGKLVKTVVADKAIFKTRIKGVKAGDKRVTVKVGAKRMFSAFLTVK